MARISITKEAVDPFFNNIRKLNIQRGGVDPFFNNVSLLLPMDASFADFSSNNFALTAFGDVQISNAVSKFGGGAAFFDGNGDYLRGNAAIDYSGDFTIEGWFNRTGVGNGQVKTIFEAGNIQPGQGGVHLYVESDGTFVLNNGFTYVGNGGASPLNQWVHFAVVRNGGTNTLYVNGVAVHTDSQSYTVNNNIFSIGGAPIYGFYINGYIDDFRITEGVARYTADFTPPNSSFSAGKSGKVNISKPN